DASGRGAGVVVGATARDLGPVARGGGVVESSGETPAPGQRGPHGAGNREGEVAGLAPTGAGGGVGGAELVGDAAGAGPGGDGAAGGGEQGGRGAERRGGGGGAGGAGGGGGAAGGA